MKERLATLVAVPTEKLQHLNSLMKSGQVTRPVKTVISWDELSHSSWTTIPTHKIVICFPFYADQYGTKTFGSIFSPMLGQRRTESRSRSEN